MAVRLNLLGHPGEQPDYVVAAWVLPYVYALRGDRDWRRSPQLTGSRQVSPLAIQAYKRLEAGRRHDRRAHPVSGPRGIGIRGSARHHRTVAAACASFPSFRRPGRPAQWQLLRQRYQKAIAEGASTSQVTAISVLASIYLQAVIAATMEEVEIFLSPLTARSKIREVLRGLVATRQVHTLTMGHAPHYYVAGTLPEFAPGSHRFTPVRRFHRRATSLVSAITRKARLNRSKPEPEVTCPRNQRTARCRSSSPTCQREFQRAQASREREAGTVTDPFQPASSSLPQSQARASLPPAPARPAGRQITQRRNSFATARNGTRPPANGARPAANARWTAGSSKSSNGAHSNGNGHSTTGLQPEIGPGNHPWPPGTSATALRLPAVRRRPDGPAV